MTVKVNHPERRKRDPYLDRRLDEDRRQAHSINYFFNGGSERRTFNERRTPGERRKGCTAVGRWSSICASNKPAPQ